ncbi:glycosyltransferase [Oceanirhabdus sp. W0125-5]|uniref:glycosyltransferase n=1 Tax=Oceanirhabdus sp. W0125-5 TaxID=2999116 RepID=UPI0022F3445D|nr:glycosyltransferase [Oceanirhabdus sp. W0125-5]WBW99448.1 glycosyltransferase [Oceanirhabdus sp. W0125-5]
MLRRTKLCILSDADSIHTKKWVDYLSQYNYEISIISMRDTKYVFGDNVKKYIIEPPFKNKLSYFFIISKFKKLIEYINPDILHGHFASSYGLYGALSKKRPYIVSVWGRDVYEFPKKNSIAEILLRKTLKSAEVICSTSEDMAEETKKYCNKEIIVTPFGVDTKKFSKINEILEKEYITIGLMKNLKAVYGINYLIDAFSMLIKEYKEDKLKLLIVGDGVERRKLEEQCKELKIQEFVEFKGNVENTEIPKYINEMDIVCLPSLEESFGVAAVEASACGRPIVSTSVGGLKETVIDGLNGIHCKCKDPVDLKNKLMLLLSDKKKMKDLGNNGIKLAHEKYTWEKNAEIMQEVYARFI